MPLRRAGRGRKVRESGSSTRTETILIADDDDDEWKLRLENINIFECEREYENRPGIFTVVMHHGGIFHEDCYIGGRVDFVDQYTTKKFKLIELSAILVALEYNLSYICEFYYAEPERSQYCVGNAIGHPLRPLVDGDHMEHFLSLLEGKFKLIHVYETEVTKAEALLKSKKDQNQFFEQFYKVSSFVVIEDIDEPEIPRPTPKSLLLGWHDRDIEFDEFLVNSLENAKKRWREEDAGNDHGMEDLLVEFNMAEKEVLPPEEYLVPENEVLVPEESLQCEEPNETLLREEVMFC
ncbi:hypothetical protein AAHA92_01095 [Salvia divinorum]|uniref:PB1-like domain-containing protein n=1 Tax=Salvia divinorum TaxID=28513 RepID=A0ABD1IR21_SALDI